MKKYEITISFTGYQTVTVTAETQDEAEETAMDGLDAGNLKMTEQYVETVTELPPEEPSAEDLTLKAALLMERVGGSFAASIAKAWIVGDSTNKRRVYTAFPELFAKYTAWALEDSE